MSANWLERILPNVGQQGPTDRRASVPEGLWRKCPKCESVLYEAEVERNQHVCPRCQHHLRIGARARIALTLDAEGQEELAADLEPIDILRFKDSKRYADRIAEAQASTGEKDALVVIKGTLNNLPVVVAAFEFDSWAAPWARWLVVVLWPPLSTA